MHIRTLFTAAIAAITLASPALAEECTSAVSPTAPNEIFGDLALYDFGNSMELQIDTPTQPTGLLFAGQIDGEDREDIILIPGLDDILLSVTPASGELSVDLAFLSNFVNGKTFTVTGYNADSSIAATASYDMAELATELGKCGIR
ncbi:hypothetical protein [Devosia sp.]|uniref:hypothetical protein n=1 Tax=Devosia sp. TaxID=1871048 RepID=UPI001AFEC432|nr:hypothetical protein [Devosia sp.]MBO9588083.1 hypothetical protein [Devosia sp.]